MLHINNHEITGIYHGQQSIDSVYKNLVLIWSKFSDMLCCFANGYWIDQYPWVDDSSWKDNN